MDAYPKVDVATVFEIAKTVRTKLVAVAPAYVTMRPMQFAPTLIAGLDFVSLRRCNATGCRNAQICQTSRAVHLNKNQVLLLLVVFSACGGIRTGINKSVLTAYFPVLGFRTSWERVDSTLVINYQF